jgi:hypothetical protein
VPGYWRHSSEKYCRPCNCDLTGSLNSQCSPKDGQCVCKPGVGGQRCDQCLAGFYGFGEFGCKSVFVGFDLDEFILKEELFFKHNSESKAFYKNYKYASFFIVQRMQL